MGNGTDIGDRTRALLSSVDPMDLLLMILYVCGVVLLIYAIMQLVHGLEARDRAFLRRGCLFLILSALLMLGRVLRSLL